MKIISLTILLIASVVLSTAEDCGGRGTHRTLRVGDCTDDGNSEDCVLPTGTSLTLAEDFVLSANSDRVRIVIDVMTQLGHYTVLNVNFDNLIGGQQYTVSQDVNLSPQLAGQRGTFLVTIFDVASDQLEICGVFPNVAFAE